MNYKTLADLPDVAGQNVLVRLDLNVPVQDGNVMDDFRIKQALPTISLLQQKQAKVVIISHIEGGTDTLKPVYEYLKQTLPISFCEDCLEQGYEHAQKINNGEILLCENLRLYDGEKKNDKEFAKKLASLGNFYVNDAFSVSHRSHASVVGVPQYLPSFIGLQFQKEIENLSKAFNPSHPFLFILGGAKFDTKLPLVKKFLNVADTIYVCGALANDFYKAKGLEVGHSLVSDGVDLSSLVNESKIILPIDVVVEDKSVVKAENVSKDQKIMDDGPESLAQLADLIKNAKAILWNGPLGNYELGFTQPTIDVAQMIADSGALSLVGGGDTLAAISSLGLESKFTFISTGGGAMLDFLANETLPGLEVLKS